MSEELKPCPFCGGKASDAGFQSFGRALKDTHWADGTKITDAYFVNCPRCGVSNAVHGIGYRTKAAAIAAWNRRAGDPT